jgi:sugar phosphate permease
MWGIPAALFLIAFFHRAAPGVIAKELMQTFGATGALVGLLASTYFYAYAGLMIPGGVLIDAYGVRRVVAAGGAVMGVGTLAMAAATSTWMLFGGRLLVGAGATVTFVGVLKIASVWFPPARFGTLSALSATVGVLGSLTSVAPLAWLVASMGWRGAFTVVGAVTLGVAVVCGWAVRDRPAEAPGPTEAAGVPDVVRGMMQVLRNRRTWPPFLTFFFLYSALGNLMLWAVPFLRDVYGLPTTRAALYASAPSLALLVSAPLTGWVSDRIVHRRKTPYTMLTSALVGLWVVFVLTLGALPLRGVFALFFAMGIFSAAFVLTWPIGREVNPPHLAAVAVAVVNLGGFLGAALTQAPLGAVLDARWAGAMVGGARAYPVAAYRATFTACASFVFAAALLSFLLRETYGRNIWSALGAERGEAGSGDRAQRGGEAVSGDRAQRGGEAVSGDRAQRGTGAGGRSPGARDSK